MATTVKRPNEISEQEGRQEREGNTNSIRESDLDVETIPAAMSAPFPVIRVLRGLRLFKMTLSVECSSNEWMCDCRRNLRTTCPHFLILARVRLSDLTRQVELPRRNSFRKFVRHSGPLELVQV
jgi:hypothetical protein